MYSANAKQTEPQSVNSKILAPRCRETQWKIGRKDGVESTRDSHHKGSSVGTTRGGNRDSISLCSTRVAL